MRTFRTEEEILALLDEYDNSNMTVREFCELCDISDATFYNWRNKYRPKPENNDAAGFASLEVIETQAPSEQKLFARIGQLEIFHFVEAAYLKQLLS